LGKHIQVQLLIELREFTLGTHGQQFCGHGGEDAVVAGGVIAQGMAQLRGHQTGIAGISKKMLQASQ
jgi:hypothetical protein